MAFNKITRKNTRKSMVSLKVKRASSIKARPKRARPTKKQIKITQLTKRNQKPLEGKNESKKNEPTKENPKAVDSKSETKENEPPRRNPVRKARRTSKWSMKKEKKVDKKKEKVVENKKKEKMEDKKEDNAEDKKHNKANDKKQEKVEDNKEKAENENKEEAKGEKAGNEKKEKADNEKKEETDGEKEGAVGEKVEEAEVEKKEVEDKKKEVKKKEKKVKRKARRSKSNDEELQRMTLEEVIREEMQFIERFLKLPVMNRVGYMELGAMVVALQVHMDLNLWGQPNWPKLKNCRHLTLVELKASFDRYKEKLSMIATGDLYNGRHRAYITGSLATVVLNARDSIQLFRYQQIELILQKLMQNFGESDEMCKYHSEVLLPEFCLMVFMDTYSMAKDEAVKYLKSVDSQKDVE